MKVSEILRTQHPVVSFEFFPPKTDEGLNNLLNTITDLKQLGPSFVSMTYGAGGSTRTKTVQLVAQIKDEIGLNVVAHLTCVGHSQNEIESVLRELADKGVENILALRGDPPKGQATFVVAKDGFAHASDLVRFIKKKFSFCVGGAGYPEKHIEAPSMKVDLKNLKEKINQGADFIVTQLFFDNDRYFEFVEKVRSMGLNLPIIPGIMPITDFEQIKRFAQMCGATIPLELQEKLAAASSDKARVEEIGIDYAARQCNDLIRRGAPGIHFYTLNKSRSTREVFLRLKEERVLS